MADICMGKFTVSLDGRHLYDEDFTHDVRLDVDGDWESQEQRIAYAEELARRLNSVQREGDSV